MKVIVFSAAFFSVLSILSAQDHSEFIEGPFASPQEVTETCLTCHEEAGDEVMSTRHWQWQGEEFELKDGRKIALGKRNLINNFCIAVTSNWPRCTSCHIGYGWKDMTFDFTDPLNIDCLVCHEQTGTYKKSPAGAGYPEENVDLLKVAQSVALPKRANCGTCHFDGGGGTGVKHGDMDDSLYEPSAELDVHMGGNDFQCTECHLTEAHKISGAGHGSMAEGVNHISCMDCHDEETHSKSILNQHIKTVACDLPKRSPQKYGGTGRPPAMMKKKIKMNSVKIFMIRKKANLFGLRMFVLNISGTMDLQIIIYPVIKLSRVRLLN